MQAWLLTCARLLLFGVFATSGIAKLADRAAARQSLIDFGVPASFAASLATILIAAELVTAIALLPLATLPFAALGALALLVIFSIAIAANLAHGRRPACNCFGQLHSEPIGWSTVARNAVLAIVAGVVVWNARGPHTMSLFGWARTLTTAQLALLLVAAIAVALLAATLALLLAVLRQQGRLLLRFEALETHLGIDAGAHDSAMQPAGLPPESPAPAFELQRVGGQPMRLDALLSPGKDVLLLFTNPNCGPCQALLPEVVQWERDYAGTLTLAIISEGSLAENEAKIGTHGIERLLLQEAREVAELYEAHATPAAVLVGSDGTIASYVASGGDAIRSLLHAALARAESPNGAAHIQIGDAAPELALRDLDGGSFTNSDLLGTETLLLFWSPACGYCQQMLPDLRAWELNPPPQAPRLFVISTGSQNENRALMLRSRIAIHDELGSAFGASGTPMAVRLDAEGRVASGVAAGAQAVFALMA